MKIIEITENKKQYLDLLLIVDEEEDMVDRYLKNGTMYILDDNDGNTQVFYMNNAVATFSAFGKDS